mgnify:CR=1 FL=1
MIEKTWKRLTTQPLLLTTYKGNITAWYKAGQLYI